RRNLTVRSARSLFSAQGLATVPRQGSAPGLSELQAYPCFRQTLAGDAVEYRQRQEDQQGDFRCRDPAGHAGDRVQDDAEGGAETFLREKVRVYAILHQIRMDAQNMKHDK